MMHISNKKTVKTLDFLQIFRIDVDSTLQATKIHITIILTQYLIWKLNRIFQSGAVQIFSSCLSARIQFACVVITCSAARCATVCLYVERQRVEGGGGNTAIPAEYKLHVQMASGTDRLYIVAVYYSRGEGVTQFYYQPAFNTCNPT
jgi:hypothetical protein